MRGFDGLSPLSKRSSNLLRHQPECQPTGGSGLPIHDGYEIWSGNVRRPPRARRDVTKNSFQRTLRLTEPRGSTRCQPGPDDDTMMGGACQGILQGIPGDHPKGNLQTSAGVNTELTIINPLLYYCISFVTGDAHP